MSKFSVLSKLLLFTILFLSTALASPVIENSPLDTNQVNGNGDLMEDCIEKMKLGDIAMLIRQRNVQKIAYNAGCGVRCAFEKSGLITADNKIDVVKAKETFELKKKSSLPGKMSNVNSDYMEACAKETNDKTFEDNCDMFADMIQCIQRKKYQG